MVEIPDTSPPLILPGMVCDECGEKLLSASTVIEYEQSFSAGTAQQGGAQ